MSTKRSHLSLRKDSQETFDADSIDEPPHKRTKISQQIDIGNVRARLNAAAEESTLNVIIDGNDFISEKFTIIDFYRIRLDYKVERIWFEKKCDEWNCSLLTNLCENESLNSSSNSNENCDEKNYNFPSRIGILFVKREPLSTTNPNKWKIAAFDVSHDSMPSNTNNGNKNNNNSNSWTRSNYIKAKLKLNCVWERKSSGTIESSTLLVLDLSLHAIL